MTDTIILVSTDNKKLEISKSVACTSTRISDMIDLGYYEDGNGIPTNVKGDTLLKIIEYMKYESEHPTKLNTERDKLPLKIIKPWIKKYLDIPKRDLFELLKGANYLNIKPLTEATCYTIAGMMARLTPDELRKEFDIPCIPNPVYPNINTQYDWHH